jgi:hypothetical protein
MANYHVLKNKSGEWTVKRAGSERASGTYNMQRQAERAAKKLAANSGGGEVRIHGRDGRIRDSDTISATDPFPPRDKKH